MFLFHKKYKQLLFVSIIVEIVGSALVQDDGCAENDHVGYQCEKYGCGKTGSCSLGVRPGVIDDSIFPCTVGRNNYWMDFEKNLPQTEECRSKDCEPSFLTDIAFGYYSEHHYRVLSLTINFTVPPATVFPSNYYPTALSLKVSSETSSQSLLQYLDKSYHSYPRIRLFRFESSYNVERYLTFPCILMIKEDNIEYRILNLEFTVFSLQTELKSGARNLTKTLQYNVTILTDNIDKDKIKTIAVARYPSQNDLLVIFDRVKGAEAYIVRAVDNESGKEWGMLVISEYMEKMNCSFDGIKYGTVQIEITVKKERNKEEPVVKSLPIYFGVKSVPADSDSVNIDTVVLSAISAAVLASIFIILLVYCRRISNKQKLPKPEGLDPKILLLYSKKWRENKNVAKAFADYLKQSFDTQNVVFEDDDKEKIDLNLNINFWYDEKVKWSSHVIVIWFPGAEKSSEEDPTQNHFPKTLSSVKDKCRNLGKEIICIHFEGLTKPKNIPTDLMNISKDFCFPNDHELLYQHVVGHKSPNNKSFSNMSKLKQNFPSLHNALANAKCFYKNGISKTSSDATTISSSNKSSQFGESFSDTISEIDPNCPIHGKHASIPIEKHVDKFITWKNVIEEDNDVEGMIHPPSQEDIRSISSSQIDMEILKINNMNDDDIEQKTPLLPPSDLNCRNIRGYSTRDQRSGMVPEETRGHQQHPGFPQCAQNVQYDHEMQPLLNDLSSSCIHHHNRRESDACIGRRNCYNHLAQQNNYHHYQHPHFYVPVNEAPPQIHNHYGQNRNECNNLLINRSEIASYRQELHSPLEMLMQINNPVYQDHCNHHQQIPSNVIVDCHNFDFQPPSDDEFESEAYDMSGHFSNTSENMT